MIVATVVLLFGLSGAFGQMCGQTPIAPNLSNVKKSPNDFIVGGTEAVPNSWPWQVVWCRKQGNACSLSCGGSIVHRNWVLTAGHCVSGSTGAPQNFGVKCGAHDQTCNNPSCMTQVDVAQIFLHPGYNGNTLVNDVALIRLATPLDWGTTIQPVCLPSADASVIREPNRAWTTGWGTLSSGGQVAQRLRQVNVPFVNHTRCDTAYVQYGGVDQLTMTCAGAVGIDACQGDSGGPLVAQTPDGTWFHYGSTSWGVGCADARYPGVYARASAFCQWFSDVSGGEVQCV